MNRLSFITCFFSALGLLPGAENPHTPADVGICPQCHFNNGKWKSNPNKLPTCPRGYSFLGDYPNPEFHCVQGSAQIVTTEAGTRLTRCRNCSNAFYQDAEDKA